MPPDGGTDRWREERLEILRSTDRERILAYCRKHGVRVPAEEHALWAAWHQARAACPGLTEAERDASRAWLRDHGYALEIERGVWRDDA